MHTEVLEGYRLSPQQERLWRLEQVTGGVRRQAVVELRGDLDADRLADALARLVARHESLRTLFRGMAGLDLPLQVIGDSSAVELRRRELPGGAGAARDAAVAALLREEAAAGTDLASAPLLRTLLVRADDGLHLLLLTVPALVADAWTICNLVRDLAVAYAGAGTDADADEPVQYLQFSEWLRDLLQGDEAAEGRAFWAQRRAAFAATELPQRLPAERSAGEPATVTVRLAGDDLTALQDLARQAGVPVETVLQAGWHALLARLGDTPRPLVHRAFSGRKYDELHGGYGAFALYLPIAVKVPSSLAFRDLVRRLAEELRESELQQELYLDGETDGAVVPSCVFEVAERAVTATADGVTFTLGRTAVHGDDRELTLIAAHGSDGVELTLRAAGGLYAPAALRGLAGSLAALLSSAAADPATAVGRLPVLGDEERHRLLDEVNASGRTFGAFRSLPRRISARAAAAPAATAVVDGATRHDFADLERLSNRLAHRLRRLGAAPEVRVGLLVGRSAPALVGLLGIWKAGAAYVPLDPDDPAPRIATLAAESGSRLVVTLEAHRELLPEGVEAVLLDGAGGLDDGEEAADDAPPAVELLPQHLAYVLHTSGSTGRPKGVMVTHGALDNLTEALAATVYAPVFGERGNGRGEPLRVGLNAPLAFDASVKQIVQLAHGHGLWVVPDEVRPDGAALAEWAARESLDALDLTPSQLRLALDAGWLQQRQRPRLVLLGGEALDAGTWALLAADGAADDGTRWVNVYGPTETTVDASARAVAGAVPRLGGPLPNVRLYVADAALQPLPAAVPGELLIGGAGLARGYAGKPAATAERFVPDPFGGEPGGRLYRSGDRVRFDSRGEVEYLGRLDAQVKLRGLRIELGEVEAALARQDGVRRAAATVREDVPGDLRLVGYVVPRRDATPGGDGASRHRLPNGLVVAQQNRNETEYLYQEIFTSRSYLRHGLELPENPVVFDVGANIGMFTLFVAGHRPGAKVYAFEPIGPIYETLQANARAYAPGAKLFRHGLSCEESTATFSYYPGYSMMSGLAAYADAAGEVKVIERFLRNEQAQGEEGREELLAELEGVLEGRFEAQEETARLRRLADVVAEEGVERIDLLKVDVQRAELDVLRGLDDAAWGKVQQVVMEVHDLAGGATEGRVGEIRALLEGHGFHVLVEQDEVMAGTDRFAVYAARHELDRGAEAELTWKLAPVPLDGVSPRQIRDALKAELPDYMVPSAVAVLDELPLTRNGKVDRAALPAPEDLDTGPVEVKPPRTLVEEVLCSLWSEVLHREKVGIDEDFFELGGHSLLATQLVSRVREAFEVELPLRSLFTAPTVAELAVEVGRRLRVGRGFDLPPVEPVDRSGPLPLSFAQQRLWFLQQLDPQDPAYNSPKVLRLAGALDVAALAATWTEVVRRHEVLRTRIEERQGQPWALADAPSPVPLPRIDLAALDETRRQREALRLARAEAKRPFDLARRPPLRLCLLHLAGDDHLLLFTLHHIAGDAWSLRVLEREMVALYPALRAGRPSPLPELPVQYADYAVWQRRHLEGEALEAHLAYWREQLPGETVALELPLDRPRPPVQTSRGGLVSRRLAPDLAAAVEASARQVGGTRFMVLLAAWQALLGRYCGQTDVRVGTPVAGRTRREVEDLIGFFVNTLVLRADLAAAPTFRALVAQVREAALGAQAHQDLPFERLVEELAPGRDLSRSPLFQVMFDLRVAQGEEGDAGAAGADVEVSSLSVAAGIAKYDLTLTVLDRGDELVAALEHNRDLFDEATAEAMLERYEILLGRLLAAPDRDLAALPLARRGEIPELLAEQRGRRSAALPENVLDLIDAHADASPDAVAVVGGDLHLTYGELRRRSSALAGELRRAGVGPEVPVAVCLERSPEMVAALLAVLRSGGHYVPVDPSLPAERLAWMLTDLAPPVLLTLERLAPRLPRLGRVVLCLDSLPPSTWTAPATELPRPAAAQAAYAIYTSGSTGEPKAVVVSHGSLANYARSVAESHGVGPGDRLLQFHSVSFDASAEEIYGCLAGGATLLLRGRWALTPEDLVAAVQRLSITVLSQPTAFWHALGEAARDAAPGTVAPLRRILYGGERAQPQGLMAWRAAAPWVDMVNTYGPTEGTVVATNWDSSGVEDLAALPQVPIGRSIDNLRTYVLDAAFSPQPHGVPGELYLAGAGVARGYRQRPALTAERFLPDPFADAPGSRMYRTGDLARPLPGGVLEFVGRADSQVKVRGFRVETGEVEAALAQHPAVGLCAVVARRQADGTTGLEAHVVARPGLAAVAGELRTFLRQRLPDYMVPAAFAVHDELPLTAGGKLDRRALQRLDAGGAGRGEITAPRNPLEARLAEIWCELLGLDEVGVLEDFFEIGGHSLLATRLVSRVRSDLGRELSLQDVFRHSTVAALAEYLDGDAADAAAAGDDASGPRLQRVSRDAYRRGGGESG